MSKIILRFITKKTINEIKKTLINYGYKESYDGELPHSVVLCDFEIICISWDHDNKSKINTYELLVYNEKMLKDQKVKALLLEYVI